MNQPTVTEAEVLQKLEAEGVAACLKTWRKPPLPTRLLRNLFEAADRSNLTLEFLVAYPFMPSDMLSELARLELSRELSLQLVNHPRLTQEAYNLFAESSDPLLRAATAQQKRLPTRILTALARDPHPIVRAAAASSSLLKVHWQAYLTLDTEAAVRVALAENQSLDPDIALLLAVDESPLVRSAVAAQAPVEVETLSAWLCDEDLCIAFAVMSRTELPPELAQFAAASPHPYVRQAGRERWPNHAATHAVQALDDSVEARIQMAARTDLSDEQCYFLCKDASSAVRAKLCENSTLSAECLEHLYQNDPDLRPLLVVHPQIQLQTLLDWQADEDPVLRKHMLYRNDFTDELLENWVNARAYIEILQHLAIGGAVLPWLHPEIAADLARHVSPSMRRLAATADNLSPTLLKLLASDPSQAVRLVVAQHPMLPSLELDQLAQDADPEVVKVARASWKKRQVARERIHSEVERPKLKSMEFSRPETPQPQKGWMTRLRSIWQGA